MMLIMWLDDVRPPPKDTMVVWVRSVAAARLLLETGLVEQASLDHDLGGPNGEYKPAETGYDLCKWMAETGNWPLLMPQVHSMNPVGADAMRMCIARHFPRRDV